MAAKLVQHAQAQLPASGGSVPLIRPTLQGDTLIAVLHHNDNGTLTLPAGWVQGPVVTSGTLTSEIWYIPGTSAGNSVVAIGPISSSNGGTIIALVSEWADVLPTSPLDQTGTAIGNSATPAIVLSAPTGQPNELVIAGVGVLGSQTATLNGTAFTRLDNFVAPIYSGSDSYRIPTVIETSSESLTLSRPLAWTAVMASFFGNTQLPVISVHSNSPVIRVRPPVIVRTHVGPTIRLRRASGQVAIDIVAPGDTPAFEIDTYQADGQTSLTAITAGTTAKLFNKATGKLITAGGPISITIAAGVIQVIIPTAMCANPGTYQCDVQVQFDPTPGYKTVSYVFKVESPEFS